MKIKNENALSKFVRIVYDYIKKHFGSYKYIQQKYFNNLFMKLNCCLSNQIIVFKM